MMDMNTVLMIKNKKYSMQDFKDKFGIEDDNKAIKMAELLITKGKAEIYKKTTVEEDMLEDLEKSAAFLDLMEAIDQEEEDSKKAMRNKELEDVDTVNLALDFSDSLTAVKYENIAQNMGIENIDTVVENGLIQLRLEGISPMEYSKIVNLYKADRAIESGVKAISKGVVGATNVVNYAATNVVAPTAKIATTGVLNLGKGLAQTGVKVGAGLITGSAKAIKETKVAIETDTDTLRAKRELIEAKDSALRFFRKKFKSNKRGSGIGTF